MQNFSFQSLHYHFKCTGLLLLCTHISIYTYTQYLSECYFSPLKLKWILHRKDCIHLSCLAACVTEQQQCQHGCHWKYDLYSLSVGFPSLSQAPQWGERQNYRMMGRGCREDFIKHLTSKSEQEPWTVFHVRSFSSLAAQELLTFSSCHTHAPKRLWLLSCLIDYYIDRWLNSEDKQAPQNIKSVILH